MGLFNLFKSSKDEVFEKFANDKISKEKCITHYFQLFFQRKEGLSEEQFNSGAHKKGMEIMGVVSGQFMGAHAKKTSKNTLTAYNLINKNPTLKVVDDGDNSYHYLIRFRDSGDRGEGWISGSEGKSKEYMFSPIESYNSLKILPNIKFGLNAIFGLKSEQGMTNFIFIKNKPYVFDFDNVERMQYPIAKRIELYKKYPEIDTDIFGGMPLPKFIDWIEEKGDTSPHMKKYWKAVKELTKDL